MKDLKERFKEEIKSDGPNVIYAGDFHSQGGKFEFAGFYVYLDSKWYFIKNSFKTITTIETDEDGIEFNSIDDVEEEIEYTLEDYHSSVLEYVEDWGDEDAINFVNSTLK